MKKFITACVLFAVAWLSTSVFAFEPTAQLAVQNPAAVPKAPLSVSMAEQTQGLKTLNSERLISADALSAKQVVRKAKTKKAAVAAVSDLAGEWVQTYKTMVNSGADGGKGVTIETVADAPNSIKIVNFFDLGFNVTATVDLAAKKITIPNQIVYESETLGKLDVAVIDLDLSTGDFSVNREKAIEGTINDDGTISIPTYWGVFGTEGDNKDKYLGLFFDTKFERANATMSQRQLVKAEVEGGEVSYRNTSYNIIVEQTAANTLAVKNFGNYGMTVEFILNRDLSSTIESQVVRQDPVNGAYMTAAITYKEDASGLLTTASTIVTEKATDKKVITWKDWTTINTKYYTGIQVEGKITAPFEISYPTLSVTEFEGEGTAESPYLIKKLDDLILLGDIVNSVEEADYNGVSSLGKKYNNSYTGAYFRMENDIDMSGYRFSPIGDDWQHRFNGTFDGNNFSITGLSVSTGAAGYAALFGNAGDGSVIKNLTVKNPVIKSQEYYAAAVAGWSQGTIENCHVSGAEIYNEGSVAGALAGVATVVKGCSADGCNVTGLAGHVGGLVGQVVKLIENSYAVSTSVVADGVEGNPAGGLTGSLYEADAYNCYFSGSVNTNKTYAANMQVGGIGGFLYKGTMDRCFSVATVSGYDNKAYVGGVVGTLQGTMTNCYSAGMVYSLSSRYTGGLTGYISAYEDADKNLLQSVVKNCYTSASVTAETYMYDPEKEVRETLGTINPNELVNPTVENIFFDKNITNFNSVKYGTTTSELTKAAGVDGFDAAVWTVTEGQYPRLKGIDENEAAYMSASAIALPFGSTISKIYADAELHPLGATTYKLLVNGKLVDDGYYSSIENNRKFKLKTEFGTDTLFVSNGKTSFYYFMKVAPMPYEGIGTAENPFLIKTKDELIKLSEITSVKNQLFPETYFKIANDIDLQYDPAFLGICTGDAASNKFAGTIDGGGHAIHNMYFNTVAWEEGKEPVGDDISQAEPNTKECVSWKGFVGRLDAAGVVKNLTIAADAKLLFFGTAAPVVAYNYGLVDNCRNYADVVGVSCWIGGISGQNVKGGKITNCYNAGNITSGYMAVGGISGVNYGTIENSANVGDVAVKSVTMFNEPGSSKLGLAGGIAGNTNGGLYRNVVNAGAVYAEYSRAGGITGSLAKVSSTDVDGQNDMYNAINFGVVESASLTLIGGLGGVSGTEGTLQNNYWDKQILPLKANGNLDYEGMNGVETSVLTSGTALEGFDAELWDFTAGQYPVLKQFVNEEKLADARKAVVKIPAGVTVKDLSKDAELTAVDGLTWSLSDATAFSISGNTVKSPASVEEVTRDILKAKTDGYEKRIPISRMPAVPLAGEGTAESPYIIASADDWNNVSDYMTAVGETFEGKFLKLGADIDFTDKEFKMLAADGANYFQGSLDGDNKTVSGIKLTATATGCGAIRIIGDSGKVSNLTIAGDVTTAYASTGGFAGGIYGTLVNCVNQVNVTSTKGNGNAGFGELFSSASLTDCVNKATITGVGMDIAGLASEVAEGAVLVRCGNEGKIVNNAKGSYTAGLIGTANPIRLEECYNTGVIEITNVKTTKNVAGLIGYATASKGSAVTMELIKCYNTASVSGNAIVAGLIAATNASSSISNPIIMTGCYNTGDIVAISDKSVSSSPTAGLTAFYTPGSKYTDCWNSGSIISPSTYSGGIAGYYKQKPTEDEPLVISGCYNTGDIVATGNQGGGIIASASDYVKIDNCYNTGDIEGGFGLGGIAGRLDGANAVITNSWNSGKITTEKNRAGGISGYGFKGVVENCFNVGDVASSNTNPGTNGSTSGYGIGGLAGQGGASFTNCYNTGTVTGASQVGGLIGVPYKNSTKLERCYNIGKIVAEADTCGALIGANLANGRVWAEDNKVVDSYYVTDFEGIGNNNTVGTATTVADLAKADMGEGWTSGDDYTLPIPTPFVANQYALINAVTVAFAEGDSEAAVTKDFFVGAPEGIAWTASVPNISFSGTNAMFSKDEFIGKATLTATAGELTRTFEINCDKKAGVGDIVEDKVIVKEVYYNTYGVEVPEPDGKDGNVYIVVRTYDDGTSETLKFFNVK